MFLTGIFENIKTSTYNCMGKEFFYQKIYENILKKKSENILIENIIVLFKCNADLYLKKTLKCKKV